MHSEMFDSLAMLADKTRLIVALMIPVFWVTVFDSEN